MIVATADSTAHVSADREKPRDVSTCRIACIVPEVLFQLHIMS